jgi:hypothetical protein
LKYLEVAYREEALDEDEWMYIVSQRPAIVKAITARTSGRLHMNQASAKSNLSRITHHAPLAKF